MATWKKEQIIDDFGIQRDAQFPIIVSASRSTDIPAFYCDWFLSRLKKGHSAWTNPFNGVKSYISYRDTKFIIFWSKNPKPLIETGMLDYLEQANIKCYIQYTLNDYEGNRLELNIPPLSERIDTFKELSKRLGKNAIIWRFDPLILTDEISIDTLLNKIERIGEQLRGYTEKMVFSFADIVSYKKVESNLKKSKIPYKDWNQQQMIEFAKRLCELKERKRWEYELATCGEAVNLNGIKHNRCIDGDLITKISWRDNILMNFLKTEIHEVLPSLFEPEFPEGAIRIDNTHYFFSSHKKDPGQRIHCGCMAAKDIGEYNTCIHMCEYCYANTSKQIAIQNNKCHKDHPLAETITGR